MALGNPLLKLIVFRNNHQYPQSFNNLFKSSSTGTVAKPEV